MGRRRPKRRRRHAPGENSEPVVSRRYRRYANLLLTIFVAIGLIWFGQFFWRLYKEATTDLVVYAPAADDATLAWIQSLETSGLHVRLVPGSSGSLCRDVLHIPTRYSGTVCGITVNPERYVISGHIPASVLTRALKDHPSYFGIARVDERTDQPAPHSAVGPVEIRGFWHDGGHEIYAATSVR